MPYTAADVQMVDAHIIQGERHIVRQEELIERLRERGLPTEDAEEILEAFKATLVQHRAHRERMLRDVGEY